MNTSGDRLKALLRECNLAPADFAAHRKVSSQHVNNWFTRGVPQARIEEIADLLSVNAKWLRSGEGPKYKCLNPLSDDYLPIEPPPRHSDLELSSSTEDDVLLPFLNLPPGNPLEILEAHLRLPRVALEKLEVDPAKAFALTMPDNSMADPLPKGSTLAIDRGQIQIFEGELYALLDHGMLRVKRLYRLPGSAMRLRSNNFMEYPDQILGPEHLQAKGFQILGWVFWTATLADRRPQR